MKSFTYKRAHVACGGRRSGGAQSREQSSSPAARTCST